MCEYVIKLAVTDILPAGEYYDESLTTFKNWTITVLPENSDPTAVSETLESFEILHDGNPVTDNASIELIILGSDEQDDDLTYQWLLDGIQISDVSENNTTYTYEVSGAGQYNFEAEVCDCYDSCIMIDVPVMINPEPNEPPVAENMDMILVDPDSDVNLNVDASDPENDAFICEWTQLNGISINLDNPVDCNVSFVAPVYDENTMTLEELLTNIAFDFELRVTDVYGAFNTSIVTIEVESPYEDHPYLFNHEKKLYLTSFTLPVIIFFIKILRGHRRRFF